MWTRSGAVLPKPAGPPQTITDIPLYAFPGAMHPKPAGPLQTLNAIPLYAGPGARALYAIPGAAHSKPAGPHQTLSDIPLYAVPGTVHPKPAGLLEICQIWGDFDISLDFVKTCQMFLEQFSDSREMCQNFVKFVRFS